MLTGPSREVSCLCGARVRDVSQKLPNLVQVLVFQEDSGEVAGRSQRAFTWDFRALGQLVYGAGAWVVVTSIPLVVGKETKRSRKTHLINIWLRGWFHWKHFVFF